MSKGIILLGHGSRREQANEVLLKFVEMVKETSAGETVGGAFLQFTSPGLEEALEKQVQGGVKDITVVPVFLFNGIHLVEDIPEILQKERSRYPGVTVRMTLPLGADPRIGEIIQDRVKAARVQGETSWI